jgi:hypothetical protein
MLSVVRNSVQAAVIIGITFSLAIAVASGFVVHEASRNPPRAVVPHDMPSMYAPDPEVGYVMKPNLSLRDGAESFDGYFINDRGFRIGRSSREASSQADILVVGCSQTYGQGVSYEDTFAAIIGQKLNRTVANLGVSSYGGVSSVLLARRFKDLNPSILVYGFWEDHLYRNVAKCATSYAPFCISLPYFTCRGEVCRTHPPADNAAPMSLTHEYARDLGKGRQGYGFMNDVYWTGRLLLQQLLLTTGVADKYVQLSEPSTLRAATFAFFGLVAKETNDLGVKPIVVFIPYYFDDVIHDTPDYVLEGARKSGVHLVPLTNRFRAEVAVNPRSLAIPGDGHLTPRAHRIIAEEVVNHVVTQGVLQGERGVQ